MTPFPIQELPNDIYTVSPMLIVMLFAMIGLMVDLFLPRDRKGPVVFVSLFGLVLAAAACGSLWGKGLTAFSGSVVADDFSLLFQFILIVVSALSIALSERYVQQKGINYGEYYALLLFSASGAMLMAASRELITIFIGLEVLSIALYVLSGFARTEARSEEAAMKYFLLGAFSSGFFLYGIALVYGGAGTTRLDMLAQKSVADLGNAYTLAGAALLIVGLSFKAAIVPFHSWTPDVYEGAPTSVTAFMSAGAKAGAFAAFIRVVGALLPIFPMFESVLWGLAILTMIVGNVLAVSQVNIKRMLAYSSIAHAGYILVGLLSHSAEGNAGVLFYILAYTFMNLGAFGVLIYLARTGEELQTMDDLQGLYNRQPGSAILMAIFMLSLAGIPPTAGFMGKFYLFIAAVHAGQYALAVIGLLASVIGVFYYLRVIASMFFQPAKREFAIRTVAFAPGADIALIICAAFTLILGIFSSPLYSSAQQGANSLVSAPAAVPVAQTVPSVPVVPVVTPPPAIERASIR